MKTTEERNQPTHHRKVFASDCSSQATVGMLDRARQMIREGETLQYIAKHYGYSEHWLATQLREDEERRFSKCSHVLKPAPAGWEAMGDIRVDSKAYNSAKEPEAKQAVQIKKRSFETCSDCGKVFDRSMHNACPHHPDVSLLKRCLSSETTDDRVSVLKKRQTALVKYITDHGPTTIPEYSARSGIEYHAVVRAMRRAERYGLLNSTKTHPVVFFVNGQDAQEQKKKPSTKDVRKAEKTSVYEQLRAERGIPSPQS